MSLDSIGTCLGSRHMRKKTLGAELILFFSFSFLIMLYTYLFWLCCVCAAAWAFL